MTEDSFSLVFFVNNNGKMQLNMHKNCRTEKDVILPKQSCGLAGGTAVGYLKLLIKLQVYEIPDLVWERHSRGGMCNV